MTLKTRDFGEVSVNEEDVVTFEGPIFGFEPYSRYVFLYQEDVSPHFVWLQSTEEPELCFILVDPALVSDRYAPEIPAPVQKLLGEGEYMCWLLAAIKEKFEDSTVNLKSPVVVNPASRKAAQAILEGDYPMRRPLLGKRGED